MAPMPDHFPISLRSWPLKKQDPTSELPTLIDRILQQRGGFRDITEESLRQEVAEEAAAAAAGGEEDAGSDGEEEDEPDRLKALMDARGEMFRHIHEAHMFAAQALDFVSLLLTKDLPIQASATINPALREAIPMGSLSADKLSAARYSDAQKLDNKYVAKAWKIQSLNKTVDTILESATRLEKEIEKETKYWEQILTVSDAGWALCRLPNEKHTLGVRFGFAEAAPAFKNRSLAALRRNANGSIYLDQGIASAEPQALRVRIRHSSADPTDDTGSSTLPPRIPDNAPIESVILQARNTIFDAELWQELNRESRSMASYGVRTKKDTVTCPLTPEKIIIIDLVPLGDSFPRPAKLDDKIAEGICLALHLFLSIAHRQKHRRRTQIPPPISNQKQGAPPYNLLRPLLTRINHQYSVNLVHRLFKPLCAVLASANISPEPTYEVVSMPSQAAFIKGLSATEFAVTSLTDRLESVTTFKITQTTSIIIKSFTAMYPMCSTTQIISLSPESPLNIICKPPSHVNHWSKAEEYVLYATSCALASSFARPLEQNTDAHSWESTIAADALRKSSAEDGNGKQLLFQSEFQNGTVKLRVRWDYMTTIPGYGSDTPRKRKDTQRGEGMYEWKASAQSPKKLGGDHGEGEKIRSLQDIVEEARKS